MSMDIATMGQKGFTAEQVVDFIVDFAKELIACTDWNRLADDLRTKYPDITDSTFEDWSVDEICAEVDDVMAEPGVKETLVEQVRLAMSQEEADDDDEPENEDSEKTEEGS